jgi:hypothetical protein
MTLIAGVKRHHSRCRLCQRRFSYTDLQSSAPILEFAVHYQGAIDIGISHLKSEQPSSK